MADVAVRDWKIFAGEFSLRDREGMDEDEV
jgi:hypothetical protein